MARTREGAELTRRHRLLQLSIQASAIRDVLGLWGGVDPVDLSGTIGVFAAAAAIIVRARNQESSTAAARYFQAFREAEHARGAAAVVTGEPPPVDAVAGLIRGAGLSGIIRARQRGFTVGAATQSGFTRVAGSTTNLVLSGGRQTILAATAADPASTGRWQRITSSNCCARCAMFASRGPVYDAKTATFEAHPGCSCDAEPAYDGTRLPAASEEFRQQWDQAQAEVLPNVSGTKNDALNAFRRLREGRPEDGRRNRPAPQPA